MGALLELQEGKQGIILKLSASSNKDKRLLHGCAAPPTLHVRACKAGGWLTLRACQVALGGGATLASRIQKALYSVGALPQRHQGYLWRHNTK